MRYRVLGKTGLNVSVIGFGAATFGNVYGTVTQEGCDHALHHAIDRGVNLIDVSPYYGITLAEERLGAALGERRHETILATKCGRYGVDDFDFSAATVTRGLEESLRRLRTDYVDLLQVHDVEFGSVELILHETLPTLRKLQEQGKARFIGITGYWPGLLAHMAEQVPVDTVLNYCHWNLLMNDMDRELSPLAAKLGFGLMNASPLHMGLLAGLGGPSWHPAPEKVKATATEVASACKRHDVAPGTVALSEALKHPQVSSTFVGLRSVAQVDEAMEALDFHASPALMEEIRGLSAPVFNTVWPSGLTENQPAGVA